jgi:hypothetical protein
MLTQIVRFTVGFHFLFLSVQPARGEMIEAQIVRNGSNHIAFSQEDAQREKEKVKSVKIGAFCSSFVVGTGVAASLIHKGTLSSSMKSAPVFGAITGVLSLDITKFLYRHGSRIMRILDHGTATCQSLGFEGMSPRSTLAICASWGATEEMGAAFGEETYLDGEITDQAGMYKFKDLWCLGYKRKVAHYSVTRLAQARKDDLHWIIKNYIGLNSPQSLQELVVGLGDLYADDLYSPSENDNPVFDADLDRN